MTACLPIAYYVDVCQKIKVKLEGKTIQIKTVNPVNWDETVKWNENIRE